MNPYFLTYGPLKISWFMFLSILSIIIGYFIVKITAKEYGIEKKVSEDTFFILLFTGFIGARLTYVLLNIGLYKNNYFAIFKLSHMNLNLIGGIVFSFLALFIVSKKYEIDFFKLFKMFVIPYYFSMALGVWYLFFEGRLIGKYYNGPFSIYHFGSNRHPLVIYLSSLFVIGILLESLKLEKINNKNFSYLTFIFVILAYYGLRKIFV